MQLDRAPGRWVRAGFLAVAVAVGAAVSPAGAQTGVSVSLQTGLLHNIGYTTAPVPLTLNVAAATRTVNNIDVNYTVYDVYKNPIGAGTFNMPLVNGQAASQSFSVTPPANGWYTVDAQVSSGGQRIAGKGLHFGITPKFRGMATVDYGPFYGNHNDTPRIAFSGMRLDRVNTNGGATHVKQVLDESNRLGVNLLVQFESAATANNPTHVTQMVTALKGQVKYWEIWNEPNFSISPENYVNVLKQDYQIIKSIDPAAVVLAPALVSMDLNWHRRFYQAGGAAYFDALSMHDYEGNEAIDPGHWRWKVGELRKLMAEFGDSDKDIWQTERAIGGVRGNLFLGGAQAIRVGLQRDVLETLGVPNERNHHYYINQHGYSSVPTYAWSDAGPHPMALTLRTREAMTMNREYVGTEDFGPTGNKIFFALNYQGTDGSTMLLRNYGTLDRPVTLNVQGGSDVTVVDSFGNQQVLPVVNGKVNVMTTTLPVFVRLAPGQEASAQPIDFGTNIASQATFTFSGSTSSNNALLTNGIFEAAHPSNPNGTYWQGQMGVGSKSLTMTFPTEQTIDKAIIYTVRADNPYCALLDYDLQYWDGSTWVTLEEVRAPVPGTDRVDTPDSGGNTWYMDQNFYVNEFDAVTTDALRIVAHRVTLGFQPDLLATNITGWYANSNPQLMLREIEIYAAAVPEPVSLLWLMGVPMLLIRRRQA